MRYDWLFDFFFFFSLQRGVIISHLASYGSQKAGTRTVEQPTHRTLVLSCGSPSTFEVGELCNRGLSQHILYDSIYIKFESWHKYSVAMKFGRVLTLRVYGLGRGVREPSFLCGANTPCGNLGGRVYVCKRVYGCKNVSRALLFVL